MVGVWSTAGSGEPRDTTWEGICGGRWRGESTRGCGGDGRVPTGSTTREGSGPEDTTVLAVHVGKLPLNGSVDGDESTASSTAMMCQCKLKAGVSSN